MAGDKRVLFVSYNAVTEPLVKSQVLPYMSAFSEEGVKFFLLSFEKNESGLLKLSQELASGGIGWIRLKFHARPIMLAKAFDFITGFFIVLYSVFSKKINIVHTRGVTAAAMALIPAKLARAHFIFDMKSSLAEAYRTSGRIKEGSITYRALKFLEKICASKSDEVIVETGFHKASLEGMLRSNRKRPRITVIPCCVDIERFRGYGRDAQETPPGLLRLVYLGSLSGWYMISEMLDFFSVLKKEVRLAEFLFLAYDKDGALAGMAAKKGLEGIKISRVDYDDVPRELAGANAGILFKFPNQRLDSFPIKIGEYLAAGLPVVINSGMGDVEDIIAANRVGVVITSCDDSGYSRGAGELKSLLKEGDGLKKRCVDIAKLHLSTTSGISLYKEAYDLR